MKLKELATRIDAHLKRFEADEAASPPAVGRRKFWNVWASPAGRYVSICYISYQGILNLTKQESEQYLAWLDAGNVGYHWQALQQKETHDVITAGSDNYPRFTCISCDVTIEREAYMNLQKWCEVVLGFVVDHPCEKGESYLAVLLKMRSEVE